MDKLSRAKEKLARIPVKVVPAESVLPKPKWLKVKLPSSDKIDKLNQLIKSKKLVTVCEEASCPNLPECYGNGTATFMIMGDKCTRRCSFCDVGHGKPDALDKDEPTKLAQAIKSMQLQYAVITSVDRDDLLDGGGEHFLACTRAIKKLVPETQLELLVPDFRGRLEAAFKSLLECDIVVLNHNVETVPRLYKAARPGSDYKWSLNLLQEYKKRRNNVLTKSGIMLGLGESMDEIKQVLQDMRKANIDIVTIGQYLSPSKYHMPVARYVPIEEFNALKTYCYDLGFKSVASGPLVRSSYHADQQAKLKQ